MSGNNNIVLGRVESASIDGRLRTLRFRQRQFQSLYSYLSQNEDAFLEACQIDDSCSKQEAQIIFAACLIELRNHYDALDLKTDLELEYSLAKGKSNEDRRLPICITYIIPDTFNVLFSVLSALCAAIEAGSCAIVELETTVQETSTLLRRCISESLDKDAIGLVSSRARADFLSSCVVVDPANKLDATESCSPPRRILSSNNAPNVALIDRTADIQVAADEVVASRLVFGGRGRHAVHTVLVNEFQADGLINCIVRAMKKHQAANKQAGNSTTSISTRESSKTSDRTWIDDEVKAKKAKFILGDSDFGVVEVLDRTSSFLQQRLTTRVIVLHRFTSLDDAIDVLSRGKQPAVNALYLFAGPREAKYLSQYTVSHASFDNHIPAQLIVGPYAPQGYAMSLAMRYNRAMFEYPSPQFAKGPRSHLSSTWLNDPKKPVKLLSIAQKPLKPSGQAPSGAYGFFEQGMVLGAFVYLLPILAVSLFSISYAGMFGYRTIIRSVFH